MIRTEYLKEKILGRVRNESEDGLKIENVVSA